MGEKTAATKVARWRKGEGFMLSEVLIVLLGIVLFVLAYLFVFAAERM